MTPRQRIESLLAGIPADRIPFCPAVYEHKAALVGATPSELCRDSGLFVRALEREVELYDPDILTVGCDVYNVEAEAAGCRVRYFSGNDVPAVAEYAVRPGGDLAGLRLPDPERDGRLPLHLFIGEKALALFGRERLVRGALSGPFSLACSLAGTEAVLAAALENPDLVKRLLLFASETIRAYGRAFVERGLGVVIFDSAASPPLLSPGLFRDLVLPAAAGLIRFFMEELGVPLVPYIMGGDTALILEDILSAGTNNVLCDFKADLGRFVERTQALPVLLRANLDPALLLSGTDEAIEAKTRSLLETGRRHPRFMLGTGILPYDTPPRAVLAARSALAD
jgi:uroporphyrinogen decarboxylase